LKKILIILLIKLTWLTPDIRPGYGLNTADIKKIRAYFTAPRFKRYKTARQQGYLKRRRPPRLTTSDSAVWNFKEFLYYISKYVRPVEKCAPESGLDRYFEKMDLHFSNGSRHPAAATASFALAGDLLQDNSMTMASSGELFDYVGRFVFQADFTAANFEGVINTNLRPSRFPRFNANESMFAAIMGRPYNNELFNLVFTANNHMYDQGVAGLIATLDYLDRQGVRHVGTARSRQEQQCFPVINIEGIKTAWLAYTFGVNKCRLPEKNYYGNLVKLNKFKPASNDFNLIYRQLKSSRAKAADIICLSLHWGAEWEFYPACRQLKMAHDLAERGADIIIGHHTHNVQPLEKYITKDGREVLIIYSLGNFTSFIRQNTSKMGGAVKVYLKKCRLKNHTETFIERTAFIPFYQHRYRCRMAAGIERVSRLLPVDETLALIGCGKFRYRVYREHIEELLENQFYLHNLILSSETKTILPDRELYFYNLMERVIYRQTDI